MKPGQRLTLWWQRYVLGAFNSPQALVAASRAETPYVAEDRFTKVPVDHPQWDTPQRLQAPHWFSTVSHLKQRQRCDWQHTDERLRWLAASTIIEAAKLQIPLYVHSAFRTEAEQNDLRDRGVSKVYFPKSAHNIGEAFDLVHGIHHWDMTEREWQYIHHLVQRQLRKMNAKLPKSRRLQINWGGNDGTPQDRFRWDPAHYEIADYRNRTRAFKALQPVKLTPAAIVKMPLATGNTLPILIPVE